VVRGIAADKVSAHEGRRNKNYDPGVLAAQAVDRLAALEGKFTMSVTVETLPDERETTESPALEIEHD
jgi:hypothetical protein